MKEKNNTPLVMTIVVFAVVGIVFLAFTLASSGSAVSVDSEEVALQAPAQKVTNQDSSNGEHIEFRANPSIGRPFTFIAAGDFSSSTEAETVFKAIGNDDSEFMIALGDFSHTDSGEEGVWCNMVTARLGQAYPFQVIAGNHEDFDLSDKEADIREYVKCFPPLPQVQGQYGIEYYFDYNELARFVMITPTIENYGDPYQKGSTRYNWVKQTLEEAAANDIPWTILGMHKNCITIGVKTCEIGPDIHNLAVEMGVDLILQGDEHSYSRSKQWSLSANCPRMIPEEFNSACVVGSGNTFTKDAGTVQAIIGTGGSPIRKINLKDPEIDYFETWNGSNASNTHGYKRFTIEPNKLTAKFVNVIGNYTDEYTITAARE